MRIATLPVVGFDVHTHILLTKKIYLLRTCGNRMPMPSNERRWQK